MSCVFLFVITRKTISNGSDLAGLRYLGKFNPTGLSSVEYLLWWTLVAGENWHITSSALEYICIFVSQSMGRKQETIDYL